MDMQDKPNNVTNVPDFQPTQMTPPPPPPPPLLKAPLNIDTIRRFFQVTGGSTLYCISAVLIAYGIVKLLKPVLVGSESIWDALPCLLTLHGYELALLAVLLLIIFKKVVDDAVSLVVLISLFLVGTSIALGSVADMAVKPALYLGLAGLLLALLKLVLMRRFGRIPFSTISIAAITGVMAYNYFGPALMARSVSLNPSDESARRSLWLLLYLLMLIGFLVVWLDALQQKRSQDSETPFLQSRTMAYLFALIVLFGSGVHQYTMAYAFTLERVSLDYVPVTAMGCLLLIEVLRLSGRRHIIFEVVITCVPGLLILQSIYDQSVLSSGHWGMGLLCYPLVLCAGVGIAVAGLAIIRKSQLLWGVVFAYALGVILTIGFSPEYPHKLNVFSCWVTLVAALLIYGFIVRNTIICFSAIVFLSIGLPLINNFPELMKSWQLTVPGSMGGVCGIGTVCLYLIFGKKLHRAISIAGGILLAAFIYDYLPAVIHVRYLIVLIAMVLLFIAIWIRTKDVVLMSILAIPVLLRAYVLMKALANWRYIILGFAALAAGAWVSIFKRSLKDKVGTEEKEGL
ncbi:MAG: hypothetical protein ABFR90_08550 [Planctomycetota bacterium]